MAFQPTFSKTADNLIILPCLGDHVKLDQGKLLATRTKKKCHFFTSGLLTPSTPPPKINSPFMPALIITLEELNTELALAETI